MKEGRATQTSVEYGFEGLDEREHAPTIPTTDVSTRTTAGARAQEWSLIDLDCVPVYAHAALQPRAERAFSTFGDARNRLFAGHPEKQNNEGYIFNNAFYVEFCRWQL